MGLPFVCCRRCRWFPFSPPAALADGGRGDLGSSVNWVRSRVRVEGDTSEAIAMASCVNKFPRAPFTVRRSSCLCLRANAGGGSWDLVEAEGYGCLEVEQHWPLGSSDGRWLCGDGDSSLSSSV